MNSVRAETAFDPLPCSNSMLDGAHFTCFTGRKGQMLTPEADLEVLGRAARCEALLALVVQKYEY